MGVRYGLNFHNLHQIGVVFSKGLDQLGDDFSDVMAPGTAVDQETFKQRLKVEEDESFFDFGMVDKEADDFYAGLVGHFFEEVHEQGKQLVDWA